MGRRDRGAVGAPAGVASGRSWRRRSRRRAPSRRAGRLPVATTPDVAEAATSRTRDDAGRDATARRTCRRRSAGAAQPARAGRPGSARRRPRARSRPPARTPASPRSSRPGGAPAPDTPRRPRSRASARSSHDRRDQASRRSPWPRASAVVAMQVMTAGSGASGSCGYRSRTPLRPRIRGQRPELAVDRRLTVDLEHLRIVPNTREPATEQLELARSIGADARPARPPRRERVVDGLVVVVAERVEARPRRAARGANGLNVGAAVRRARTGCPRAVAGAGGGAAATGSSHAAEPLSSRAPRPPSSRMSDGRSRGRRRAGCARSPRHPRRRGSRSRSRAAIERRVQPARSASAPSWTSRVTASRSGPGSRSPSQRRDDRPDPAMGRGDAGARLGRARAGRPPSRAGRAPAAAHEQLDRDDALDVLEDRPRVAAGDRPHRDVVLLVRARRDRVDATQDGRGPCSRTRARPRCTGGASAPSRARASERGTAAAHRSGRRPARSAVRRSLIEPSSAIASLAKSSASATGSPWKLPPLMTRPPPVARASCVGDAAFRKHERVVGRAVHLDVEDAPQVLDGVSDGAVDLRNAAQRVRDPGPCGSWPCATLEPESRSSCRSSAATAIWPGCGRAS